MWRDELQAWLLARDSDWPWNIPHNIRYEGHPGLWHLILWIPSHLSSNPIWMQVIHGCIATACAWLWWRHAPLPWWVRIPLPFGYFFFYQYAIIARNYGISALLLFAIAHRVRLKWKAAVGTGILIALLCHTNAHSMILLLGCLPWVGLLYLWHYYKDNHDARKSFRSVTLGGAIAIIGLTTSVYQVIPPEDSGYASEWHLEWEDKRALNTSRCIVQAYAPVPLKSDHSLGGNILYNSQRGWGWLEWKNSHWGAGVALILAAACLIRSPFLLLPFITATFGLWAFFYIKFPGSIRHHGFLVLIWLSLLWVGQLWKDSNERKSWRSWTRNAVLHIVLLFWCGLSLLGSWNAFSVTIEHTFSHGKSAGRYIRDHFENDVIVTGNHRGPWLSTVVGYAEVPEAYYMGRRSWASYVIWDQHWRTRPTFREIYNDLLNLSEEFPNRDIVFVSEQQRSFYFPGFRFELLADFTGPATIGEKYVLYQVKPES